MSNNAALIGPISLCGSLNNSGTANVNGKVWFYVPGTTTPVTVYSDPAATASVTPPLTLDTGGRVPYSTYPNGIYTTQPVRLLIQDSTGQNVSDTTFEAGANATVIDNASPSLTTAPFTGDTVADALEAIQASVGGQDAMYQPYVGTTPLTLKSVLRGIQLTPQNFGAIGDGSADDTVAIQSMVTKLAANGGGRGYFPPGSYKVSATIVFPTNAVGIELSGAGSGVSSLIMASTADVFSSSSAQDVSFEDMQISGNIGLTGVARLGMRRVTINRGTSTSAYGLSLESCSIVALEDMIITGGSQVVSLTGTSASVYFNRCRLGAGLGVTTACIDIAGTVSSVFVYGTFFNAGSGGVTGLKWESGATGTGFNITDSPSIAGLATPFDTSAISANPRVVQSGNLWDDIETSAAASSGTTNMTPDPFAAASTFRATVGGGGGIIHVQPVALTVPTTLNGKWLTLHFANTGASNMSFTLDASYVVTTGVDGTAGAKTTVGFFWDKDASVFREQFRAATT